jgi:outer membrane protein assembly factor BamB
VSGDKLICFHRLDDQETIECLDARSGKQFWSFHYPTVYRDDFGFDEGPRATPAIADGRVYTFGAEGMLHCLDLDSGKNLWSVNTKAQFQSPKGFFGIACSPLVVGKVVLLNIGGGNGAGIVAFDKMTGNVVWRVTDDEASYSSPVAATINGIRQALFLTRNGLVATDPANGRIFYQYPWRPPMHASVTAAVPLVVDNLVFLSASYGAGAVVLRVGDEKLEKIWSADDVLSNHYATSVQYDGFLYGFDGRQEQRCNLRCVELKTGKMRWNREHFGAGTILLAGDQLMILTERGELIRAPATPVEFQPVARVQILPAQVRAHPALANGLFYARSTDKLVCADLREPATN